MHQQSRPPARVTSPTSGVQGLGRPTGSRDGATPTGNRSRAGSEAANTTQPAPGVSESLESNPSGPSRESIKKLDQIIQVGWGRSMASRWQ